MTDETSSLLASPLLEVRALAFGHSSGFRLEINDLELRPGGFTGVLGPNGSGKSTLLRILAGLISPLAGVVDICGDSVDNLSAPERARRIAWVPQRAETPFEWTVEEMVAAGRHPHLGGRLRDRATDREAVESAIRRVGLVPLRSRPVNRLSGGEWQRALIARALAQQARVLLLDEPVANLDVGYQRQIYELAASLAGTGIGILAADHHIDLAARYCDRLILLDRGKVRAQGSPAEVLVREVLEEVYRTPLSVTTDPGTGRPQVRWRFDAPQQERNGRA